MADMQTESQYPSFLPEVAATHEAPAPGHEQGQVPETVTDSETKVEAEECLNHQGSTKGSRSSSPTSTAPEFVNTRQSVRSDHSSEGSSNPPSPVIRPQWMTREPEIRKLRGTDWISAYEQEPFDPNLGHFVVLYAFYDKEAGAPGPSSKLDGRGSNTIDEEATEDDEPMKIIIESSYVLNELKEVTGIASAYRQCILKPPFKILTQYWSHIKRHLGRLKEEASRIPSPAGLRDEVDASDSSIPEQALDETRGGYHPEVIGPGDGRAPAPIGVRSPPPTLTPHERDFVLNDEERLRKRVAHLEMLVEFGEKALKRHLDLRAQIQDATLQRIAFADLWHLYNPGDLLLANERGNPQLYMVYNVTGGQPRLRNPTEYEISNRRVKVVRASRRIGRRGPRRGWYDAADGSGSYTSSSSDGYGTTMHGAMIGTFTPFIIDCYALDLDSTGVGALCSRKHIRKYLGLKSVSDLPLYPLKFHKDAQSILDRLRDRGRKFITCTGHRRYDGVTYDTRGIVSRERLQGEIYVDTDEYARSRSRFLRTKLCLVKRTSPVPAEVEEGQPNRPDFYVHHDHAVDQRKSDVFIEKNPDAQELMTREEMLLMPEKLQLMQHSLQAFSFKSRSWVNIEIDNVETIDKSRAARESGFQDLSIPSKYRKLLISLVDNHALRDDNADDHARMNPKPSTQLDLVRGKGLGLIILLHGPPGSGKTSTAETIAAHTGRPLYAITCGDLGESLEDIETRLDVHSKRADKWGAVLLLDEADVFLMKRDWKDTHRNAMVSIFLRTLEYYQGILFLTTNRVGVIDEAFKSRIHVSLRYPRIKLKSTLEIWKSTMNRIERDNERQDIKVGFDREELLEFAEEHFEARANMDGSTWNGRQIRNAFQTAIALGQYDRIAKIQKRGLTPEEAFLSGKKKWRIVKLTRKNLETLAETARDFDKYLKSVHRRSDGELARAEDLRDDDFSELDDELVGSRSFLSAGSAAKLKKGLAGGGRKAGKKVDSRSPLGSGSKGKNKQARHHSDSETDSESDIEASTARDGGRAKSESESASEDESDD